MSLARVQHALDLQCSGVWASWAPLLLRPVLHDHCNTGRSATISFLLHKGYIEPDARLDRGERECAETQNRAEHLGWITKHELAHRDDDENQYDHADDDQEKVPAAQRSGSKVRLCLVCFRRKLSEFLVVERGDCSFHLLRIGMQGLHRLLGRFARE